jgi:predicted DNA-binding transcriptional regulator AlpA
VVTDDEYHHHTPQRVWCVSLTKYTVGGQLLFFYYLYKNKTMIQLEPLIGIEEVCKQLGINKYTLFHRIRKNTFPKGVKIMGKRKFKLTELQQYFTSLNIESKVTI